jgi:hypothetical protein
MAKFKWINDSDWATFVAGLTPETHKQAWHPVAQRIQKNLEFIKVNGKNKPSHKQCNEMLADILLAAKELKARKPAPDPTKAYLKSLEAAAKTAKGLIK